MLTDTMPRAYDISVDPRTGRPLGDHGTANDAIEFALEHTDGDLANMEAFLRDWREGAVFHEWPEFYSWLRRREAGRA